MNPFAGVQAKVKPSIGRIVHYYPCSMDTDLARWAGVECAALIVAVWDDRCVNLTVFDRDGGQHGRPFSICYPEDQPAPVDTARWAWPVIDTQPPNPEETRGSDWVWDTERAGQAIVSDVRSRVIAIRGFADAAQMAIDAGRDTQAQDCLDEIVNACDTLVRLAGGSR
jgi:hypothetical protein